MRKSTKALVMALGFLFGIAALAGCKKSTTTPPLAPGACNLTDQTLYQSLMALQASLSTAKTEIAKAPQLKTSLNQAILDYNAAEAAWQVYHTTCASNPTTSAATVQSALNKAQGDLSTFTSGVAQ